MRISLCKFCGTIVFAAMVLGFSACNNGTAQTENKGSPSGMEVVTGNKDAEKTIEVTVSIDFADAADKYSSLSEEQRAKLPADGNIMTSKALSLAYDANATAYDVISVLCDLDSIDFVTQGEGASAYISSVSGLASGDLGGSSGWMYTVNEKSVNDGLGQYKVKNGDVIRLYYVT